MWLPKLPANTSSQIREVGSALGGIGAQLGDFAQFATRLRQAKQMADIQQSKLGLGWANAGLRSEDIQQHGQAAQAQDARAHARNTIDVWKTLTGGMGQYDPSGYGQGLGALQAGHPGDFAARMGQAAQTALGAKQSEAGRVSGTRAAASAGAKSRQKQSDNLAMQRTAELAQDPAAMEQAKAGGFKPFPAAPRQAGKPLSELRVQKGLETDQAFIRSALKRANDIHAGLADKFSEDEALDVASRMIRQHPELRPQFEAASPEQQGQMAGKYLHQIGWGDIIQPGQ